MSKFLHDAGRRRRQGYDNISTFSSKTAELKCVQTKETTESFTCPYAVNFRYLKSEVHLKLDEDLPQCTPCQDPFTLEHFLLDCIDFRITRSRLFRANTLKELFDTVEHAKYFYISRR